MLQTQEKPCTRHPQQHGEELALSQGLQGTWWDWGEGNTTAAPSPQHLIQQTHVQAIKNNRDMAPV